VGELSSDSVNWAPLKFFCCLIRLFLFLIFCLLHLSFVHVFLKIGDPQFFVLILRSFLVERFGCLIQFIL
jgi:hypothetical protein